MDVKTAFLNGTLKEELYMKIPEGIKTENDKVCKLHKSIYGLKQSARCWFEKFDEVLKYYNLKNSEVDRCLFFLDKGSINKNIYVILYVDDLLIATHDKTTMINFKQYLIKQFHMVDLQEIKPFLDIKVTRSQNQITLDQTGYLKTVLSKFNMTDCKAVNTPLVAKLDYLALNCDQEHE